MEVSPTSQSLSWCLHLTDFLTFFYLTSDKKIKKKIISHRGKKKGWLHIPLLRLHLVFLHKVITRIQRTESITLNISLGAAVTFKQPTQNVMLMRRYLLTTVELFP